MTTGVRWLAIVTAALVLIQALLIGQALYVNQMATLGTHGWLGNVTFAVAVILTVVAFLAFRRGEASAAVLGMSALTTLLLIAQLGLGYAGRKGGIPAALHIPNGVLLTGLLFALVAITFWPAMKSPSLRS
ncbi:MAG: hypothetical protein IT338_08870 [Thermomicrobiales bacterium]|nr:hypothetical protein [Thermomicrobiales bacterium]